MEGRREEEEYNTVASMNEQLEGAHKKKMGSWRAMLGGGNDWRLLVLELRTKTNRTVQSSKGSGRRCAPRDDKNKGQVSGKHKA